MKTFDQIDQEGRLHSFEVGAFIGRRGVVMVVGTIPGAKLLRKPLRFLSWFREDEFCEFAVGDRLFVAEEPFGDNSRYWIATRPAGWCPELTIVRDAFLAW